MVKPKVKLSRRLGIPLTPKAARVMTRKQTPPGQHGRQRGGRVRLSEYKRRLMEKQKLRAQYDLSETQMLHYVEKARVRAKVPEVHIADALIQLLETRLDAIVMRGGLANTIYAARQLVSHRHILVNGAIVNAPSYSVKLADTISVKPKSKDLPGIVSSIASSQKLSYLDLNKDDLSLKLLYLPRREEVPVICDVALIVEFYSR